MPRYGTTPACRNQMSRSFFRGNGLSCWSQMSYTMSKRFQAGGAAHEILHGRGSMEWEGTDLHSSIDRDRFPLPFRHATTVRQVSPRHGRGATRKAEHDTRLLPSAQVQHELVEVRGRFAIMGQAIASGFASGHHGRHFHGMVARFELYQHVQDSDPCSRYRESKSFDVPDIL